MNYILCFVIVLAVAETNLFATREFGDDWSPPKPGARFYSADSTYWVVLKMGMPLEVPPVRCTLSLQTRFTIGEAEVWSATVPHEFCPYNLLVSDSGDYVVTLGEFRRSKGGVAPVMIFNVKTNEIHELTRSELGELERFTANKARKGMGAAPPERKSWWNSATISGGILKLGYYDKPEYEGWKVPDQRLKIELSTGKVIYDSQIPQSMESSLYYDQARRIESEFGYEKGVEYFDSLVSTGWRDEYGLRMALGFARNSGNPKASLKFLDLLFETCGCISLREGSDTPPFDLIGGGGAEDTAAYLTTRTWLLKEIEGLKKEKRH